MRNIDSIHNEIIKIIDSKGTTKHDLQDRVNILSINEQLIKKINRNLNSYSANEANTNTEYGTAQILNSNLYFTNPNNDSTSDSSITPQTHLKDFETSSIKSIPDLAIDLVTPTKKTIENVKQMLHKKHKQNDTILKN